MLQTQYMSAISINGPLRLSEESQNARCELTRAANYARIINAHDTLDDMNTC